MARRTYNNPRPSKAAMLTATIAATIGVLAFNAALLAGGVYIVLWVIEKFNG